MYHKNWLEITTFIGCPNMCWYCPQNKLINAYGKNVSVMSFEHFKYFLSFVPNGKTIHFSGFSESFYHPAIKQMIRYAFFNGFDIVVYSTLMGLEDYSGLSDVTLKELHVHRYPGGNEEDTNKKLKKLLESINVEKVTNDYINTPVSRAGSVSKVGAREKLLGSITCGRLNGNVLLPDGRVVMCCSDYGLEIPLGNVWDWAGIEKAKKEFVKKMMEEDSDIICRVCEHARRI